MEKLVAPGRLVFAVAITALGVENLVCARSTDPVLPVLPWLPAIPVLGYLFGSGLVVAGVSIALRFRPWLAAFLLGSFLLACTLVLLVPRAAAQPVDLGTLTVFETLALGGAALALAANLPPTWKLSPRGAGVLDNFLQSGRFLFAASSVVFGIAHFLVPGFIASLIPTWIPGRVFWAFFTGAVLIAAGMSIATKVLDRWAAALLGTMFLLWSLLLHAPRVWNAPGRRDPDEWSSAFIALGMCGASWLLIRKRGAEDKSGA